MRSTTSRRTTLPPASRWVARTALRGIQRGGISPSARVKVTQWASRSVARRARSSSSRASSCSISSLVPTSARQAASGVVEGAIDRHPDAHEPQELADQDAANPTGRRQGEVGGGEALMERRRSHDDRRRRVVGAPMISKMPSSRSERSPPALAISISGRLERSPRNASTTLTGEESSIVVMHPLLRLGVTRRSVTTCSSRSSPSSSRRRSCSSF